MSPVVWLFETWSWRTAAVSSFLTLSIMSLGGFVGWVVL